MDDRVVVGIETSTREAAFALWTGTRFLSGRLSPERRHSVELVPSIASLLAEAGIPVSAVDRWVVAIGPGSYTGLRVGISAATGMGMPFGKRPLGVGTFDLLAHQFFTKAAPESDRLILATDARRGEWHIQSRNRNEPVLDPDRALPIRVSAAEVLALHQAGAGPIVLPFGQGSAAWPATAWRQLAPDPTLLVEIGLQLSEPDGSAPPPEPLYLRPAVFVEPGPLRPRG